MNGRLTAPTPPAAGNLSRRQLILGVASLGVAAPVAAAAATLPLASSLQTELAQALGKGQPLVVMVSLDGCPFCKVVRQNYLAPMREQEDLQVVQVDMRSQRRLRDFSGASRTHDEMARQWGVKIAPTVLFFGRRGVEVAERLVGGYLPDFYGAYLDERLQQARAAVR
jgi:thioredoxin-related protein